MSQTKKLYKQQVAKWQKAHLISIANDERNINHLKQEIKMKQKLLAVELDALKLKKRVGNEYLKDAGNYLNS